MRCHVRAFIDKKTMQTIDTSGIETTFQRALSAHQAGNLDAAQQGYRLVLELQPQHADALHLLGVIEYTKGASDCAAALIREALAITELALYQESLGNVLVEKNDLGGAMCAYQRALELDPEYASAHCNLGTLQWRMGSTAHAETAFRQALLLRPDLLEASHNLGALLSETDRFDEAESMLRHVLSRDPAHGTAHRNLGRLMLRRQRYQDAELAYRRAIELTQADVAAYVGLAAALSKLGRFEESGEASAYALAIDPSCVDAYVNDGFAMLQSERLDEAERSLRKALSLKPGHLEASYNLSLVLLKVGRYEEGWLLYETRRSLFNDEMYSSSIPTQQREWLGESLPGESLLVVCEQGLGDILQFCRYLPLLKQQGLARLAVVCPAPLIHLVSEMDGVDECIAPGTVDDRTRHDMWCFIMSLPMRMSTTLQTVPAAMPYLRPPVERLAVWKARIPTAGFKVGLVWAGAPRPHDIDANLTDQRRSMHARTLEPLLKVSGVTFFSLQFGADTRPQIDDIDATLRPIDLMSDVTDFADTAAIVANLDLVITVDTSTAHLVGALGRPVWILSRFDGCWRWLIDRDDSPWYPTARLFRQGKSEGWDEVVARVAAALEVEVLRREETVSAA
jgi:tetratricopeptide (TPR) repeat protein